MHADILLNVDSTFITHCPVFLISHQIHVTPNSHFSMVFLQNWEEKKGKLVWNNMYPLNYVLLVFLVNQKMYYEYLVFFQFLLPKTPNNH